MTVFSPCNLQLSRSKPSNGGSLLVEWDKDPRFAAVPDHLIARSAVLESLKAATVGSATMPFPLACFEVYSQFVCGSGPVDWLLNSMKVLFAPDWTASMLRRSAECTVTRICAHAHFMVLYRIRRSLRQSILFDLRWCNWCTPVSEPRSYSSYVTTSVSCRSSSTVSVRGIRYV